MSLSAAVIDALMAAGATREQLAAAIKADIAEREAESAAERQAQEARLEKKREGNRTRQQRKRERDSNASSRVTRVTKRDDPPGGSPKDINQTPSLPPVDVSEADASSHQPRAWSLPAGVSLLVWEDFKTNRKRKRLPNTETAWKKFNDDLVRVSAQTGIPPPRLIEMCTAKGWGAIYDPREQQHGQPASNVSSLRGTRPDPALDLLRAARAAEDCEDRWRAGASLPAIGTG
jgi:hypothetical protein